MVTTEQRLGQLEGAYEHLATKSDVSELRTDVRAEISELRTEVKAEISELRTEVRTGMSDLQADMARLESRLIRWMVTIMIGGMATAAGFALAVDRLVGS